VACLRVSQFKFQKLTTTDNFGMTMSCEPRGRFCLTRVFGQFF